MFDSMANKLLQALVLSFLIFGLCKSEEDVYRIGAGIADVTGPPAEVNMMGYAHPSQSSMGIHIRQYSRAFIVIDGTGSTSVFVSVDACMTAQIVKLGVLQKLKEKFGKKYNDENVMISSTHTHSTPGGFFQYVLYNIPSKGFIAQTYQALVNGITLSIERAHSNIQNGHIYYNEGELLESNINRSPTSYLQNPLDERRKYKYDTDKDMLVMKLVSTNNKPIGMISWFAVHGTSMNNTNRLISGDNKGYASQLFEAQMNGNELPGKGSFVAAFAQSNLGDVSPNTKGPHCLNSGKPCDLNSSTCDGKNELCVASGPGKDMFESTKIIGENQYKKAMQLYDSATKKLSGSILIAQQNINMKHREVKLNSTTTVKTCAPAMGESFAAGTTDGPGAFDFRQGSKTLNGFWRFVRNLIKKPDAESVKCQHPKPILLDTGNIDFPYEWDPSIVSTQVIKIGNIILAAVPGEFTTMSGRRVRDAIKETVKQNSESNIEDLKVVIAGLSNTYSSYIATFEEYQAQRYEAASTIFGPHTLEAYVQQFKNLTENMLKGKKVKSEVNVPNHLHLAKLFAFHINVIFDGHPFFKPFGYVEKDVQKNSFTANETVSVTFVSGHPNNNLMNEKSYLAVELFNSTSKSWDIVATDAMWSTKFIWKRTNTLLGYSTSTVEWTIPTNPQEGTYRIRHFGNSKSLFTGIKSYTGKSSKFKVRSH